MLWIIQMQNGGVFEAETKRKVIDAMVKYYAENNRDAEQIKSIYYELNDGRCNELCGDIVTKIQRMIESGVAEWRGIADQEYRGRLEIESEVRGMIYG